jgi:hypothetical protein
MGVIILYLESVMTPGKLNLICPQGATFSKSLTYEIGDIPVDLSTFTASLQVRKTHSSKNPVIDINTENNGITLDDEGIILLYVSDEETSLVPAGSYVYDLELASLNGDKIRLVEGKFEITPEVTR